MIGNSLLMKITKVLKLNYIQGWEAEQTRISSLVTISLLQIVNHGEKQTSN